MRLFHEPEPDHGRDAITFALGAVGGLAIGMLLSRRVSPPRIGNGLRERARTVANRLRPGRLRRMAVEQEALGDLEDAVLDAFLADEVLSERGIDVGAISAGIIELSGSVWSEDEADHAVHVTNATPGVRTVVNRLDIESEARQLERSRRQYGDEGSGVDALQKGGARVGGMGSRRQGSQTDPDRPDDSQHRELRAHAEADRQQWLDEGLAHENPRATRRSEVQDPWRTEYDEDELDNQDPHGKHAPVTLDDAPQQLNSASRVGEPPKKAERIALEKAGMPKDNGERSRDEND